MYIFTEVRERAVKCWNIPVSNLKLFPHFISKTSSLLSLSIHIPLWTSPYTSAVDIFAVSLHISPGFNPYQNSHLTQEGWVSWSLRYNISLTFWQTPSDRDGIETPIRPHLTTQWPHCPRPSLRHSTRCWGAASLLGQQGHWAKAPMQILEKPANRWNDTTEKAEGTAMGHQEPEIRGEEIDSQDEEGRVRPRRQGNF